MLEHCLPLWVTEEDSAGDCPLEGGHRLHFKLRSGSEETEKTGGQIFTVYPVLKGNFEPAPPSQISL